jgi:tetratricopeptide (TPR) repeat protein
MDSQTTLIKRKTAMVLFKIEESLGTFVKDKSIANHHSIPEVEAVKDVIEKAYLDEIFQLVISDTKDRPEEAAVRDLYKLAHELDLFAIRNAIAHPNRPFFDVFWYRVATIAADPVFEKLGLKDIKEALYSAENGTIEDPPEGWDKNFTWRIPNNLPIKSETDITGLIGRNKELLELKKIISNPRNSMVSITAPGGFGKTALVLDFLKEIVSSPDSTKWIDAIVYISLKSETWDNNLNKFIKVDALSEIKNIEEHIAEETGNIFNEYIENIDQAANRFSDRRIIFCIDNLETILRDEEVLFHEFTNQLPREWKILVTSRVFITNASIYTLRELDKNSSIKLARTYNNLKGGEDISQSQLANLVSSCFNNPLAIKMSVDLIVSGAEIPESIEKAKGNIAAFSFGNLIDTLSDNAMKVLELIFMRPFGDRKLICEIIEINPDEAVSSINELARTSLINRSMANKDKECFEINGSIKDLIITNNRCIQIRSALQKKLQTQVNTSTEIDIQQRASNKSKWHFQYIPTDTEPGLKIILNDFSRLSFNKRMNQSSKLSSIYEALKNAENNYSDNPLFLRAYAMVLSAMELKPEAELYFKKAIGLNNGLVSRYCLARFYHQISNHEDAVEIYKSLVEELEDIQKSKDDLLDDEIKFMETIYTGYFLGYLFQGNYELVLESTKKWDENKCFRTIFGTLRASAYKRKIEVLKDDPDETIKCFNSATKILKNIYRTEGYTHTNAVAGYKIIEEIAYCCGKYSYHKDHSDSCIQLLEFCHDHLEDIIETSRNTTMSDLVIIAKQLSELPISPNHFKEDKHWQATIRYTFSNAIDISEIEDPVEIVTIKRIGTHKGKKGNFLFVYNSDMEEYFIHFSAILNADWPDWLNLQPNDKLAVTKTADEGKVSLVVKECYIILS